MKSLVDCVELCFGYIEEVWELHGPGGSIVEAKIMTGVRMKTGERERVGNL